MGIAALSRSRKDAATSLTSERNRFESHLKEYGRCISEAETFAAGGDFSKARDASKLALRSAELAHAAYSRWLETADGALRDYGTTDAGQLLKQA